MKRSKTDTFERPLEDAKDRRIVAMHLQQIEGNPLTADEIAMFEMFERENWSHDRRVAYIREHSTAEFLHPAAE